MQMFTLIFVSIIINIIITIIPVAVVSGHFSSV